MNVQLYSHEHCVACRHVKKYLESKGHVVTELNVYENGNGTYLSKRGISTVPVTAIGDDFVIGSNLRWIDDLIDRNK